MENKWHNRFLELAEHISIWSKDKNKKIGAVIVDSNKRIISLGYNGFPQGMDDSIEERYERPQKYLYTEHAERNAIYTAARKGISVENCYIYISNNLFSCADCARAIIQSGIKGVICKTPDWENPRWKESFKVSREMFEECGIELIYL